VRLIDPRRETRGETLATKPLFDDFPLADSVIT